MPFQGKVILALLMLKSLLTHFRDFMAQSALGIASKIGSPEGKASEIYRAAKRASCARPKNALKYDMC